jgi:hypothetical protein
MYFVRSAVTVLLLSAFPLISSALGARADQITPKALVAKSQPANWWFVFKFNSGVFPGCPARSVRACPFGGEVQDYAFSQQFAFASSDDPQLRPGTDCLGDATTDPVGATYDEIYSHKLNYVVWNDQFYNDPDIAGCGTSCSAPWGHSKGILAWNNAGDGVVMQVSTPSWPASGSKSAPRKTDGNSLGCVDDDNVKVSQHFFSVSLSKNDVKLVLEALQNASVVTDPNNKQLVNNGGPEDIKALVDTLGVKSKNTAAESFELTTGVVVLSKPSRLHVPPWQMVSSLLGGVSLRTATWWANPKIASTTENEAINCWDSSLDPPGAVDIATTGHWDGKEFGLQGGGGKNFNHAKIGVSTSGSHPYVIFGDMNQQGDISGDACTRSQNGRGGLFFVVEDPSLHKGVAGLIAGESAPGSDAQ